MLSFCSWLAVSVDLMRSKELDGLFRSLRFSLFNRLIFIAIILILYRKHCEMLLFVQILFFSRFLLLSLVFRVPYQTVLKVYVMCLFLQLPLLSPFVYCDIKRVSERIVLLSMLGNTVVFSFRFFSPSFILKFNASLSQCFHLCSFYYSNGSFFYALNFVLNAKFGRIAVLIVVFI